MTYKKVKEICKPFSSSILINKTKGDDGNYPLWGAKGLVKNISSYQQAVPYISIVKWGAGVGRTEIRPSKTSIVATMQGILPNNNIDIGWLCSALEFLHLEKYATKATVPNLYFRDYGEALLQVPDYDRQKYISGVLKIIEKIVKKKEEELQKLDTLTKARFVEMFGRRKNRRTLQELSIGKSGYGAASASVPYDSTRPRYVRITDINDNGTLNNDCVCSINKQDDINYKLKKGDFLFARMGATVGKTYYYRDGNQIYAGYLIRFKLDPEKLLPEYLYAYTQTDEYFDWVKLNQSGAAQPGINAHKYGSLQIPMASIKEQKEFVRFVSQVDKSKFVIQKSLEKTQMLFDSLMQEYFG